MWYSALILRQRTHPEIQVSMDKPLWEESVVLIEADSEQDASIKAEELGARGDISFRAVSTAMVQWKFVKILEIHEILDDSFRHGTEVFSRFINGPIS